MNEIDLDAWTGDVGEVLRAHARDDVQVETVQFVIATEDGMLVEAGAATPEGGDSWWRYETTVDHPGGPAKVVVAAKDLPGHAGSLEVEKEVAWDKIAVRGGLAGLPRPLPGSVR